MKLKIKSFVYTATLVALAVFAGCEKNDKDLDYGNPKIYMPQSLTSGSNLNYLVPKGLDSASRNYVIDVKADRVNVLLGVLRSGKTSNDAYSVSITTKADTINTLIANNVLTNTVLLPESMYKLPQTVSVADGQDGTSFYLSIDKTQLKTNYTGKKVALAVVASNPTKYNLSPLNNKVIVIVDVNALKL
jgi:hypothetical protein